MISYILAVDSETSLLTHTDLGATDCRPPCSPRHASLLWDLLYAFMNKQFPRLLHN